MTEKNSVTDHITFTYRIASRGGHGSNAAWEWVLLRSDKAIPVKKGVVNGTFRRAEMAAEAALTQYKAAQEKAAG